MEKNKRTEKKNSLFSFRLDDLDFGDLSTVPVETHLNLSKNNFLEFTYPYSTPTRDSESSETPRVMFEPRDDPEPDVPRDVAPFQSEEAYEKK